jgi:hypothetical protein
MKADETRIYLWVTDYGQDASVVTQLIGVEPTYIKSLGQPNPQFPKMTCRMHSWEFHSPLPLLAHVNEHFEALLQLLEPHAIRIEAASRKYKAGINVMLEYREDFTPGFHLSEEIIKTVASMNLSIDFDLYFFGHHAS